MRLASPRSLFVIAFLGSALLIAIALYMEHVMGLRHARCASFSASA